MGLRDPAFPPSLSPSAQDVRTTAGYFPSGSGIPHAAAQKEFPLSASELCFQVKASPEVYSPCFHDPATKIPSWPASGEHEIRVVAGVHVRPSGDTSAAFPPLTTNCFPVQRIDPLPLSGSISERSHVTPSVELSSDPSPWTATKRPAPKVSPLTGSLLCSKWVTDSPSGVTTRYHPASLLHVSPAPRKTPLPKTMWRR